MDAHQPRVPREPRSACSWTRPGSPTQPLRASHSPRYTAARWPASLVHPSPRTRVQSRAESGCSSSPMKPQTEQQQRSRWRMSSCQRAPLTRLHQRSAGCSKHSTTTGCASLPHAPRTPRSASRSPTRRSAPTDRPARSARRVRRIRGRACARRRSHREACRGRGRLLLRCRRDALQRRERPRPAAAKTPCGRAATRSIRSRPAVPPS
jgi:hypothetical protein